jgi:hypothetical protein
MAQTCFKIAPQTLRELIEGEVVIINMTSGSYYSLVEVGATIWSLLEQGLSVESMLASLMNQYDAPVATIQSAVDALLVSLEAEELIVRAESEAASPLLELTAIEKQPFVEPLLNKYNDMQELLLVDPIHDVDESGWPNLQKNVAA